MKKTKFGSQLIKILDDIKGNGSFVTSGEIDFVAPGLYVNDNLELTFPLQREIVLKLIEIAKRASFGKGSETVLDLNIRRTWEIDANKLVFLNNKWIKAIKKLVVKIGKDLGIEGVKIEASLYKLLIYEPGDFFKEHRDSEKESGMFGTMIVGLPSDHEGGTLIVQHEGIEDHISFANNKYNLPYAAFFADCEHELEPVLSGYRVCLVYNLLSTENKSSSLFTSLVKPVNDLKTILKSWAKSKQNFPVVIQLDHQYTPANFSSNGLKHHDLPRYHAVSKAADEAGYFVRLGLLTHHQSGSPDVEDYRYGWEPNEESADMGEIHEESTEIEHWAIDTLPNLGSMYLEYEDIITNIKLGDEDPIEQDVEGFTGNAGMTLDYWYHYGAVVLWPKSQHEKLLSQLSQAVQLVWLAYYIKNKNRKDIDSRMYMKHLVHLLLIAEAEENWNKSSFDPVVSALIVLDDTGLAQQYIPFLVDNYFVHVKPVSWLTLLEHFGSDYLMSHANNNISKFNIHQLNHFLSVLIRCASSESDLIRTRANEQAKTLPFNILSVKEYSVQKPDDYNGGKNKQESIKVIERLLTLTETFDLDDQWNKQVSEILTQAMDRIMIHKIFYVALKQKRFHQVLLAAYLRNCCVAHLKNLVANKPKESVDFARSIELTSRALRPIFSFMKSTTLKQFDYKAVKVHRENLEYHIKKASLDLDMETIRLGSPHTLRLTKNDAAHFRLLKNWTNDCKLMEALNELRMG